MNVTQQMQTRYATKVYDPSKKIPAEIFAHLENTLHLSPTSLNLQPLYFVVAESEAGKARIAQSAVGMFGFNAEKILASSHAVVVASKVEMEAEHLSKVADQEFQDGRYASDDEKAARAKAREAFVHFHRDTLNDEAQWHAKQAYLALGTVVAAAAQLGVDATPIEGVDLNMLDQEFGLAEKGYTAQFVVVFGYRAEHDLNAALPKSRLPKAMLFENI